MGCSEARTTWRTSYVIRAGVACLLAFAMLLPVAPVAPATAATPSLSDLAESPSAAAMLELVALGIVRGYPDGTYQPEADISRIEYASMIVRAKGLPTDDTRRPAFADIGRSQAWAYGIINAATKSGILKGDPDGRLRGDASVNGAEAAAMVLRAIGRDGELTAGDWPTNYLNAACRLGIWGPESYALSALPRGIAAEALVEALSIEIWATDGTGKMTGTRQTLLDRLGARAVSAGQALQVTTDSGGRLIMRFPDGTLDDTDGKLDTATISPSVIYSGATSLDGLLHKPITVLLNPDGQVTFVSPRMSGLIAGMSRSGDTWQMELEHGGPYVLTANTPVSLNHKPAALSSLRQGATVFLSFGVTGDVTAVDALEPVTGQIRTDAGGGYWLVNDNTSAYMIPTDSTRFTLNGLSASRAAMTNDIGAAGVATATVTWDMTRRTVATIDCHTYDGLETYRQPLVAVRTEQVLHEYRYYLRVVGDVSERALRKDCTITRDGALSFFDALKIGDIVSIRTDAAGQIQSLEVLADNAPPRVELPVRINTPDRFQFTVEGAIDATTLKLRIDGTAYWPDARGLDRYSLEYIPEDGWTTVTVVPAKALSPDPTHTVALDVSDYAGHAVNLRQDLCVDPTPVSLASAEWLNLDGGNGRQYGRVTLFFNGDEESALAKDTAARASRLTYIPSGKGDTNVRITACDATDYTVTLWLSGPILPGACIVGQLLDNAGNSIPLKVSNGK